MKEPAPVPLSRVCGAWVRRLEGAGVAQVRWFAARRLANRGSKGQFVHVAEPREIRGGWWGSRSCSAKVGLGLSPSYISLTAENHGAYTTLVPQIPVPSFPALMLTSLDDLLNGNI